MKNFKSIYWCLTPNYQWLRGYTLKEVQKLALKNGRLTTHLIYQAVLKPDTTDEQLVILETLWVVDLFGGLVAADDRTDADTAIIDSQFMGWVTHEYRIERARKENNQMSKAKHTYVFMTVIEQVGDMEFPSSIVLFAKDDNINEVVEKTLDEFRPGMEPDIGEYKNLTAEEYAVMEKYLAAYGVEGRIN